MSSRRGRVSSRQPDRRASVYRQDEVDNQATNSFASTRTKTKAQQRTKANRRPNKAPHCRHDVRFVANFTHGLADRLRRTRGVATTDTRGRLDRHDQGG